MPSNTSVWIAFACLFLASGVAAAQGAEEKPAQEAPAAAQPQPPEATKPTYTKRGADTCLKCHDESSKFPVLAIFKTKHAQPADPRSPFAKLQCETCHGPGGQHAEEVPEGQKQAPIGTFGVKSKIPAAKQNEVCLGCHQDQARMSWKGSPHGGNDVPCAACHKIHAEHDAVLSVATQPEVCYACHKVQRAEFDKPSVHPVRFAQMQCSSCHAVHGSMTDHLLIKPTLNETCYSCHAEKRGPFLWEHAPVAENCATCHTPHGSINPTLLVKRPPLLCQQCHSQAGHPSVARTGAGLPGGTPSAFLLGGSCTNCHSQVHGSNDPSGVKLMR